MTHMRWQASLMLVAGLLAASLVPARADVLITDLSKHQVSIRSNFTGTDILLFGAVESVIDQANDGPLDVIAVVAGPERSVTVRRKSRIAGVWMNNESVTFDRLPAFYAVASTRPVDSIISQEALAIEQIGAPHLNFNIALAGAETAALASADGRSEFISALIRNKERQGLYQTLPGGVTFLGRTLFRATIDIPANVPVGLYTAKVFLVRDGKIVDAVSSPLYVDKIGIERLIFRLAMVEPLAYGLFAVGLAIFAGWLAAAVFRER